VAVTKKNQEQTIAFALCFFLNGQPFISYFFCLDTEKDNKKKSRNCQGNISKTSF